MMMSVMQCVAIGCWPQGMSAHSLSVLGRGLYVEQIAHYHKAFPVDQLLIVNYDDLQIDPNSTVNTVLQHIGLPALDVSAITQQDLKSIIIKNFGSSDDAINDEFELGTTPIPDHVRAKLQQLYAPHNNRLFDQIGMDFEWK